MGERLTRLQQWWDALDAPRVQAAAPQLGWSQGGGLGGLSIDASLLGHTSRAIAMSLPAVSRARDIICGAGAQVPLQAFLQDRVTLEVIQHPDPPSWLDRPDPNRTRGAIIADTLDDLIFHGMGFWVVERRDATGYPSQFQHVAAMNVAPDGDKGYRLPDGKYVPARDMIIFESYQSAALAHGWRAIDTAVKLEDAANRFAATEVPAGWLQQTGGVPLSAAEQSAMAAQFQAARAAATVAMLSEHVQWNESSYDPARLQLVESRQHSSTDLARLLNVPAPVIHAPSNDSMTYTNAQEQRADLWWFGLAPHAAAIADTLSGPNVTPRGTVIRFQPAGTGLDPFTDTEDETA